jgi:hypothetical protein
MEFNPLLGIDSRKIEKKSCRCLTSLFFKLLSDKKCCFFAKGSFFPFLPRKQLLSTKCQIYLGNTWHTKKGRKKTAFPFSILKGVRLSTSTTSAGLTLYRRLSLHSPDILYYRYYRYLSTTFTTYTGQFILSIFIDIIDIYQRLKLHRTIYTIDIYWYYRYLSTT